MAPNEQTRAQDRCSTLMLPVNVSELGQFVFQDPNQSFLADWAIQLSEKSQDAANLREAASILRKSDIPIAFPTETVYGLGADATRSSAVRGIYRAKQRPSDNPLIVHISSLSQLRNLLSTHGGSGTATSHVHDPIPAIYHPLIAKFWPGPLTILLPVPTPSPFAAEVTASLTTVAVRMPSSRLALALIHLTDRPLAAPSANASSKPSPTTALHVLHDLSGRIDLILDGGSCEVGVESTVVDGLTRPPLILRPGGVSIDMLKNISGWEAVRTAYEDGAEGSVPRAPGMKYKHYSPNARVLLFHGVLDAELFTKHVGAAKKVGILTTEKWKLDDLQAGLKSHGGKSVVAFDSKVSDQDKENGHMDKLAKTAEERADALEDQKQHRAIPVPSAQHSQVRLRGEGDVVIDVWAVGLGHDPAFIARGLFSALREFDHNEVEIVLVEGLDDRDDGARAAIMNRLRKAAEFEISL